MNFAFFVYSHQSGGVIIEHWLITDISCLKMFVSIDVVEYYYTSVVRVVKVSDWYIAKPQV